MIHLRTPRTRGAHGPVTAPDGGTRRGRLPGTIGARLALILTLPLLGMLALLGAGVTQELQQYRTAERTSRGTGLQLAVEGLVHQLQQERGLTNGLLNGEAGAQPQVEVQRTRAVAAQAELDRTVRAAPDEVSGGVRRAMGALDGLAGVRARVDARQIAAGEAFTFYTRLIATLTGSDLGLGAAADQQLVAAGRSLTALSLAKEYAAQERGFLNGVFSHGRFASLDDYAHFSLLKAGRQDWMQTFASTATPAQRRAVEAVTGSAAARQSAAYEAQAALAPGGTDLTVPAAAWWRVMTEQIDGLREAELAVGRDLTARSDDLRTRAFATLWGLVLAAVALTAGAIAVVLVATRSITRPLGELVREADDVAQRRLPEAVRRLLSEGEPTVEPLPPVRLPRRSSVEVKGVVASLDRMQEAAHRLALEQAVMRRNTVEALANLGRRNQNLVRRQLGLISQLERQESEPAALANLFQLDHLAARMRRNAESLLVVAGERRSRNRSTALPIADAIRASTSGVEDYVRVSLQRVDDAMVHSAAVSDVVHLLAELIENGLAFSPPDADLEVHGRWVEQGYLVAIVDHGVGMAPADLAEANARLQAVDGFLWAPSRFLGHHVVARLGRRLDARITLTTSPVTGVTARVILPAGSVVVAPRALPDVPDERVVPAGGPPRPASSPAPGPSSSLPLSGPVTGLVALSGGGARTPLPERALPERLGPGRLAPERAMPERSGPAARHEAPVILSPAGTTAGTAADTGPLRLHGLAEGHRGVPSRPAPHERTAPAPPAPPSGDVAGRTRNGLPRRTPGGQFEEPGTADGATGRIEPRARVDHSPEQVRTRLGAFRSGVRRGQQLNRAPVSPAPGAGPGGPRRRVEEEQ